MTHPARSTLKVTTASDREIVLTRPSTPPATWSLKFGPSPSTCIIGGAGAAPR